MNEPRPPEPAFDAPALARDLLRSIRSGALGTLDAAGFPFTTLVTVATDSDGSPLLLTSRLSGHTANLERDPRMSLLLARAGRGDPLAHPRLTLLGRAARTSEPRVRARFLARHPKAGLYADFPDFSFWRVEISGGHLNGGFARAAALKAEDVLTDIAGAQALVEAEPSILAELNEARGGGFSLHAADPVGASSSETWRVTGVDPDGIDLLLDDRTARIPFPHRVTDPEGLFGALKDISDQAQENGMRWNAIG
jgi:putative heme iron utilization protein